MKGRPGYVAPVVAMLASVLLAGLVLKAWAAEDRALRLDDRLSGIAAGLRADDLPRLAAEGISAAGVEARPGEKYGFLRTFRYRAHPTRAGGALSPADAWDKVAADGFVRGRDRPAMWRSGGTHYAAAPRDGAVAVVWAPEPGPAQVWGRLFVVGAMGLLLWLAGLRWGPSVRLLTAMCAAAGYAWMSFGVLDVVLAEWGSVLRGDVGILLAAPLPPLVFAAGVGLVSRGRASPHRAAYAYVAPALVGMGLLVLVPFAIGVLLAFMRHTDGQFVWVGFENFVSILKSEGRALSDPLSFYFTLGVTVLWTALNVVFHAVIGLAVALLLDRDGLRFKGVYRMLLIVPWAVPNYITALVWKGMFNKQYGLVNHLLGIFGIEPVGWFSSFWAAFTANVVTNTWLGFPFMMVVALGALQSIPRDLYEAAEVDGATAWEKFRAITLPLLKPAMFPALVLGSIWTFNMFNIIYLVSGGQPTGSTDILIVEAYRFAFEQDRYGYAAAYSVLIFLMLLGYSLVTNRVTKAAEGAYG